MARLKKATARCLLVCSLLVFGCSDDSKAPAPDTPLTDGSVTWQDAAEKPDTSPLSCVELEQVYLSTLETARACEPRSSTNQCTTLVPDRIVCGCDTPINTDNVDAVAKLRALGVSWDRKRCAGGICPPRSCDPVEVGTCAATPRTAIVRGLCEALLP